MLTALIEYIWLYYMSCMLLLHCGVYYDHLKNLVAQLISNDCMAEPDNGQLSDIFSGRNKDHEIGWLLF